MFTYLFFPCLFLRKPACQLPPPHTQLLSPPNSAPWLDFPSCRDTEFCLNDCNGFSTWSLSYAHTPQDITWFVQIALPSLKLQLCLYHTIFSRLSMACKPLPSPAQAPLQPCPSSSPSRMLAKLQPFASIRHTGPFFFFFFFGHATQLVGS